MPVVDSDSSNAIRLAVCVPEVRVAHPQFNAVQTIALMLQAADAGAAIAVFPELGLSAYTCEDLFHQQTLLNASRDALGHVLEETRDLPLVATVGLPLQVDGPLYNCAAVISRGRILGLVPKTYLPAYREFYELRQFTPADVCLRETVDACGQRDIPFGTKLLFQIEERPACIFFVEICEDLWTPIPPSATGALAGATVLVNLSASNVIVSKDEYRRQLVANQSLRCIGAYAYSAAGYGESTTDMAWDGHGMIYVSGARVAETKRFAYQSQMVVGDIDLDRIVGDRTQSGGFRQAVARHQDTIGRFRSIRVSLGLPVTVSERI